MIRKVTVFMVVVLLFFMLPLNSTKPYVSGNETVSVEFQKNYPAEIGDYAITKIFPYQSGYVATGSRFTETDPGEWLLGNNEEICIMRLNDQFQCTSKYILRGEKGFSWDSYSLGDAVIDETFNELWICGSTSSENLPVSMDAFQKELRVGDYPYCEEDGFIASFSIDAIYEGPLYCTYYGGYDMDSLSSICIHNDRYYFTGDTSSSDIPLTKDAYQRKLHDDNNACIVVLDDSLDLVYSSYYGKGFVGIYDCKSFGDSLLFTGFARNWDECYDYSELVTNDAFKTDFSDTICSFFMIWDDVQMKPTYFSFLGGEEGKTLIYDTFVLNPDTILMVGETNSIDFSTTENAFQTQLKGEYDGYMSLFSFTNGIQYSTYFGGVNGETSIRDVIMLDDEKLVLTGHTTSKKFPVTEDAYQKKMIKGFNKDSGFLVVFSIHDQLIYSTYLGNRDFDFISGVFLLENSLYIPWVECDWDEGGYSSNVTEFTLSP